MILDSPIITGSLSSGTGTSMSGSFSGSFEGNGSGLTGITAEWDGTHTGTATFIGNITASGYTVSASTFIGDGSQLSGISTTPFPFVGDAQITGSILLSGSISMEYIAGGKSIVIGKGSAPNLTGGNNTIVGTDAAYNITTGYGNAIMGWEAGYLNSVGSYNVNIGYRSGRNTTGDSNVFIGNGAGYSHNSINADRNIGIGEGAVRGGNGSAANNIGLGYYCLQGVDSSTHNIGIGYESGRSIDSGAHNITFGYRSGYSLTSGDGNIIIGSGSLGAAAMANQLRIGHNGTHIISGSLVTGDIIFPSTASAAYFSGDGSQLTNLPAVAGGIWSGSAASIYTGDGTLVYVSGSLIVSQSYTAGDSDSIALKVMGSGSVSGSALFEVQGANTTLFSVTDDLTDELFAANDASGLSIISAFADRTVRLGKPGGFGIVISGSNPMPTDEAAKIFITGSIYHTGSAAQFSVLNVNGAYSLPQVVAGANDYVLTAQTDGTTAWSAAAGGGAVSNIPSFTNSWFMG
jgi:hypothetical protein